MYRLDQKGANKSFQKLIAFKSIGLAKYIIPCSESKNSDKVIDSWLKEKPINAIANLLKEDKSQISSNENL